MSLDKLASSLDESDELKDFRQEFVFPKDENGNEQLYFAGHSLGLMPKNVRPYIEQELEDWERFGVEGHLSARKPWLPYHENITSSFARLVGAQESEVVAMNTLTVNLHLMLVSFYRPTQGRFKILIENNTFPSDKYAVDSQVRYHGRDAKNAVVELRPSEGKMTLSDEEIVEQIKSCGDELALVMLGNCNYLSGQHFDFEKVVEAARSVGAMVGFNLAHGAGNLTLSLHDWDVDFAVWCSYKYLNSGPGGLAGAFVHQKHLGQKNIPRFEGWWGHNKSTRFEMGPDFDPLPSVEAWQLSNPPIFQLASLRASMELFDRATMSRLGQKRDRLTSFFENSLNEFCGDRIEIVTPEKRGSMLCVRILKGAQDVQEKLAKRGACVDFRYPDILRMTPIPLYNSYRDVYRLSQTLGEVLS